jgi:hypothetical protein
LILSHLKPYYRYQNSGSELSLSSFSRSFKK